MSFSAWILAFSIGLTALPRAHAAPSTQQSIPGIEKTLNFGMVYTAQWASYLLTQHKTIAQVGSFDNWRKYPLRPHFDKDSFGYNLIGHSISGQYYYLFYRSRGYSESASFLWTAISSTAFEFTIETVTERPSYQDLYQTPVFGTTVGIGVEKLSRALHRTETWYGHALGYLLNPLTLFPQTSKIFGLASVRPGHVSATVGWEF